MHGIGRLFLDYRLEFRISTGTGPILEADGADAIFIGRLARIELATIHALREFVRLPTLIRRIPVHTGCTFRNVRYESAVHVLSPTIRTEPQVFGLTGRVCHSYLACSIVCAFLTYGHAWPSSVTVSRCSVPIWSFSFVSKVTYTTLRLLFENPTSRRGRSRL